MIHDRQATVGINAIVAGVNKLFFKDQIAKFIQWQREAFEQFPDGYNREQLSQAQKAAKMNNAPFEPDIDRAERYAESSIEFGVGQRLRGAFACYKVNAQLECIRHIVLALDSICVMLEWDTASAYLNEQNRVLLDIKRAREAV